MGQRIQLQIVISIGRQQYILEVHSKQQLRTTVQQFLADHQLSSKYEENILATVAQHLKQGSLQIKEEAQAKKAQHFKNNETKIVKSRTPLEEKKLSVNDSLNAKETILQKLKEELLRGQGEQPGDSQLIYEKWKKREKQKNQLHYESLKSRLQPQKEEKRIVSPDHFYRQGLQFQEANRIKAEQKFKEIYPFRTNKNSSLSPLRKKQLHQQLFKDHRVKKHSREALSYLHRNLELKKGKLQNNDRFKAKVEKKNQLLDGCLEEMLKRGQIQPLRSLRSVSKSPFRSSKLL